MHFQFWYLGQRVSNFRLWLQSNLFIRVAQMGKFLRDKHLTVRVKRMLTLLPQGAALRPLLEYAAEVLVPSREHCRALESVTHGAA